MKKIIIAAIARNGVIGKSSGEMPWHVKEEFRHFKETTTGSPVIMGRKTFDTLGKPLKGRLNIVVSSVSPKEIPFEGMLYFSSLEAAIEYCEQEKYPKIFIIGGGSVYRQSIGIADEMILSYMKFDAEGEVLFPDFEKSSWIITNEVENEQFTVVYYSRKEGSE